MSKDRRSVSIDADVNEAVEDGEFSNNVNAWARQYYINGRIDAVSASVIDDMRESVEHLRESLRAEIDAACDEMLAEIDAVDSVISEHNSIALSDALRPCAGIKQQFRTPENDAIQRQAGRADVSVDEFIDALNQRYPTDRFGNPTEIPTDSGAES